MPITVRSQQLEHAVLMLDQCRAAFYPVSRIRVKDISNPWELRVMDVTADDAIELEETCVADSDD